MMGWLPGESKTGTACCATTTDRLRIAKNGTDGESEGKEEKAEEKRDPPFASRFRGQNARGRPPTVKRWGIRITPAHYSGLKTRDCNRSVGAPLQTKDRQDEGKVGMPIPPR